MARFTKSATVARFIPHGATKVSDKQTDAVVYVFDNSRGKPAAIGYAGKATKATFHYSFMSTASREKHVREFFAGQRARLASKAETKAKRTSTNNLVLGDILKSEWGYDQTNVDFYEVTAVSGQYVTIRKIGAVSEDTGNMSGRCIPQSGQFIGEPMRKLVQWGDSVKIASYASASKWNTHRVAGVPMGEAANWTAYH